MSDKQVHPIAKARLDAGLTQKQAAEFLGIPKRTLENWEQGKRKPPDYILSSVLEKLETI